MRRSAVRLAAILHAAPVALAAQDAPLAKHTVISLNPLALVFGGISGEYEHSTGAATAVALGASLWDIGDFDYSSVDAKFRFYPNGVALRGFAVAGTAGYTHVKGSLFCLDSCEQEGDAITAGVELGYQWLLGRTQSFALTVGGGAKRLFYTGDQPSDASDGIPTFRFSIGYAF
jgi:hypothetical protein